MEFNNRIKDFWEGEATIYSTSIEEELKDRKRKVWRNLVLDNVAKDKKLKILDVGCGPGFFPIILSEEGHDIIGTDITENMIKEAIKNAKNEGVEPKFQQMDCMDLKFDDETFDVIICRNLTWTISNPIKAYKEWKRVLKKGGTILIFDANWNLHYYDEDMKKEYEENIKRVEEKYGPRKKGHANKEELQIIEKGLFMSDKYRPNWDLDALINLGFSQVFAKLNISDDIWDEVEKEICKVTPMFLIGAVK